MPGPLDGVTVLDLSTVGPASRCTALLRDLAAAVVKVLAPVSAGRIDPPWHSYGAGREMRRIRIDLRADAGREAFLKLASAADVVVESYRPGVASRLGVGYEDVRARNSRIVYASITGYGQDGPYAHWAGHDLNYLALGGFLHCQSRRADSGPALPGATVADSAAGGMLAALAITAALLRRERTGEGEHLDVSTADGVISLMSLYVDEFLATGKETGPGTSILTGRYACYDVYETRDEKWLSVAAIEPQFFANLCRALGRPELGPQQLDDARQDEIRAALREAFATKTRDEWTAELASEDTCVAPVLSIAEVTRDEHYASRGVFCETSHPEHGVVRQLGPLVAGSPRREAYEAPGDATHADELLARAGLPREEIDRLKADGIVE